MPVSLTKFLTLLFLITPLFIIILAAVRYYRNRDEKVLGKLSLIGFISGFLPVLLGTAVDTVLLKYGDGYVRIYPLSYLLFGIMIFSLIYAVIAFVAAMIIKRKIKKVAL